MLNIIIKYIVDKIFNKWFTVWWLHKKKVATASNY